MKLHLVPYICLHQHADSQYEMFPLEASEEEEEEEEEALC